ncbi:MAG: exosortase system-associated protein, TIGR04073 family [Verrucomicrobiales bacterium]|jgi:putative exosortase-associated protein (TIGR04073 family)|nr:exosortase system-associated protein, TIGR04073 family [Verrucomicrobiales bacterium]
MKQLIAVLTLVITFSAAHADLTMPKKPTFYDRLGQGLANLILAPTELFDSTYALIQSDGPTVGTTKGLVQGTSRMIMDMGIGIAEIVTSPFGVDGLKAAAHDSGSVNLYPPADFYDNWY